MSNNIDNTLAEDIYPNERFPKKQLILLLFIFFISIIFSVPWSSLFKIPNLAQMTGCPIQTSELKLSIFPPGPSFKSVTLPSSCTGLNTNVVLDNIVATLGGISFSPLGPVVNVKANLEGLPINLKLAIGINSQNISLYYEKLSLTQLGSLLKKYFQFPAIIEGQAKTDIRFSLKDGVLDEYLVDITSNDLNLPAQIITLFKIPELALKHLNLKIQGKKNKALVEDFSVGSNANLFIQSKGNVLLNFSYPDTTRLDLNMELKLSPALNQDFSIIGTFLSNNKVAEGHYKFKLSGNLNAPSIL